MLRTRLVILLAAGTAAGTVVVPVVVPAAPASAAVGLVVATATSGYNSTTAKSAYAQCPADRPMVYSAGGQVTDGLGFVVLTDAYANAELTGVIAWGHENGEFGGSWSVTAYALCGPADRLQRVSAETVADPEPGKAVVAHCPEGTAVYGTGYELAGGYGRVLPTTVRPGRQLAVLTVAAYASSGYAADWSIAAHAICGPSVPGMTRETASSGYDYTSPKVQQAGACPAGTTQYGLGAEVLATPDTDGYLALSQLGGAGFDSTTGETLGWWWYWLFQVNAYAICVP